MNGLTDRLKHRLTGKKGDRIGPILNGNAVLPVSLQTIFGLGTSLMAASPDRLAHGPPHVPEGVAIVQKERRGMSPHPSSQEGDTVIL